jgi:repressor LexA
MPSRPRSPASPSPSSPSSRPGSRAPSRASLTERQARVMAFIRDFAAQRGYPPTHAEIAAGLGFKSANAATEHVRRLAGKGALTIEPGLSRGLRLAARGAKAAAVTHAPPVLPVIGEVAAGQPILAQENVERTVDVDAALFRPRADFLLRVRGDSMIEAGIEPGDLLAVHKTPEVRDGQIAVVRLDDDVTVKRFHRIASSRSIVLEPANRTLSPTVVDPARVNVAIEGLVVGLLRLGLPRAGAGERGRGRP